MLSDQKVHFFTQISKRSPCTHLHHSELDSVGQCHITTIETFPAYPKTTWCEDSAALHWFKSALPIATSAPDTLFYYFLQVGWSLQTLECFILALPPKEGNTHSPLFSGPQTRIVQSSDTLTSILGRTGFHETQFTVRV